MSWGFEDWAVSRRGERFGDGWPEPVAAVTRPAVVTPLLSAIGVVVVSPSRLTSRHERLVLSLPSPLGLIVVAHRLVHCDFIGFGMSASVGEIPWIFALLSLSFSFACCGFFVRLGSVVREEILVSAMSVLSWNVRGLSNHRGVLCVPSERLSSGLCILWETGLKVLLLSSSLGHIDAWVTFPNSFVTRIIGFNGNPDLTRWIHSWELLRHLSQVDIGPWMCCGDFDEILSVMDDCNM
ncbi:unnamed protein product [Prunus brigantina]